MHEDGKNLMGRMCILPLCCLSDSSRQSHRHVLGPGLHMPSGILVRSLLISTSAFMRTSKNSVMIQTPMKELLNPSFFFSFLIARLE